MTFVVLALALAAQAAPSPELGATYPCTVERRCSANGLACDKEDRACKENARTRGLEINCDTGKDGANYVYCPPMTGRGSDSPAQWILLGVAGFIAVGGSVAAWLVLRKK